MDVATYLKVVNGAVLEDFESSMILPLCVQWEPLMGRVDSVKLQLRTAEVWLLTSGGSVMMFGASNKQRGGKKSYFSTFSKTYIFSCLAL